MNPPTDISLVIFVQATVKHLFEMGREFAWPKPERCPRCGGRMWGHGFITAWFDDYQDPLWLKRYRCPDCRCVIRLRPQGYFKRFQASILTIRDCLVYWIDTHRRKAGPSPPRQRHWVRALREQLLIHHGLNQTNLLDGFDGLWGRGIIPVSRST